jgi:hypothetical protein
MEIPHLILDNRIVGVEPDQNDSRSYAFRACPMLAVA